MDAAAMERYAERHPKEVWDFSRRSHRIRWWLGWWLLPPWPWRCERWGHSPVVYSGGPDSYGPTVVCSRCDEVLRDV